MLMKFAILFNLPIWCNRSLLHKLCLQWRKSFMNSCCFSGRASAKPPPVSRKYATSHVKGPQKLWLLGDRYKVICVFLVGLTSSVSCQGTCPSSNPWALVDHSQCCFVGLGQRVTCINCISQQNSTACIDGKEWQNKKNISFIYGKK